MCGILGTVNSTFDEALLDLLKHRGPDDSGLSSAIAGRHRLTLGHRRLSILDLSPAGHQPMWTRSGRFAIVYNGEIYNHLDLRVPGVAYRGHSDTETVLDYLAKNGATAASNLNGIFALAFLDLEGLKLFLIRDGFGVKPLYYYAGPNDTFSFASELRPLRQLAGASVDPASLGELLRLRYLPAPDTLYRGIRKLRPGHILELDLSRPELHHREYPFITRQETGNGPAAGRDMRDEYRFLLTRAVRRQLLSDVEIGVLLSGGVDSALIAGIAQRETSSRMKAFTVGFDGQPDADEVAGAAETATITGMEHHVVKIGSKDFFDALPVIASVVEEPLATTSAVPMHYLAALAAGHVKVVLSGQGADEAMGGYRRYQGELLRDFLPPPALSLARACARWTGVRSDPVLRGLDSLGEKDDVRRFESVYGLFGNQDIHRLIGIRSDRPAHRIRYFFDLLDCRSQKHSVERMMTLDLRMNLSDDLLMYTDKITMHHSLECRVPLLDLDLVRWVESLPHRYRVRIGRSKILHKQIAEALLPATIVRRKKKGFASPTDVWFRESRTVGDVLLSRNSRFSTFFDLREVRRIVDAHRGGLNRERHIFLLLSLYYWMDQCLGPAPLRSITAA